MTTCTPFSFSVNQQYVCKVDTHISLNLESNRDPTAKLFFTDENKIVIPIPEKMVIYNYVMSVKNKLLPIHPNYYTLSSTDRYEIMYKDKIILSTETTHSWNVMCPSNTQWNTQWNIPPNP